VQKPRLRKLSERPLEYSEDPPQPYWPTFIEKLLLTIIDAHPLDERSGAAIAEDTDRQKRLDEALDALFGKAERRGNKHIYLLHAAVAAARKEMPTVSAAAFERTVLPDLAPELRTVAKSKRAAFAESASLTRGNSDASRQKRIKQFEKANRAYLTDVAVFRHHQEEEDMFRDLHEVARVFLRWNLPCLVNAEALGMASLWGPKTSGLRVRTEGE
jgi:hypothetical protein